MAVIVVIVIALTLELFLRLTRLAELVAPSVTEVKNGFEEYELRVGMLDGVRFMDDLC
jgi:hypothetical protein